MATAVRAQRAFRRRARRVQSRPTRVTPSQAQLLAAAPLATPGPMARLRRAVTVPQQLYGHTAQGNSTVSSDARGQAAAQPGKGTGAPIANASPYPEREIITPPSQLLLRARTQAYQHGRAILRDRRIGAYRGRVTSSARRQATGGTPNPEADGPPRAAYRMINRTLSWQVGVDATRMLDNPLPKPATTAGNVRFPLGTQGDPWSVVYGGTPGLANHRAYGFRGGPRGGPAPRVVALPGGPHRPGRVLQQGSPLDGPQILPGGPPWGLHSPTVAPVKLTSGSQRARFAQVRPPRVNRPLDSKTEGQSMDQGMVHLDGRQAVKIPRARPGRQPGLNARFRSTR